MSMKVKIWGSRGSIASPRPPSSMEKRIRTLFTEFKDSKYAADGNVDAFLDSQPPWRIKGWGGNTLCVEVSNEENSFVIDAGSGIRQLGLDMLSGPAGRGEAEIHLVFTHFHWDHIVGLPFFVPLFIPGNKIHIYAVQDVLTEAIGTLFQRPYFPLELDAISAEIIYHHLEPRTEFEILDFKLTPYLLDHSDPTWGFRVVHDGRVYAHCSDTECKRYSPDQLGEDLPLYQGANLMVFDAQYTLSEHVDRVNWGHATALVGLELAMREKVERVLFLHHDPAAPDHKIADALEETRMLHEVELAMAKDAGIDFSEVEWEFAYEGMEVEV